MTRESHNFASPLVNHSISWLHSSFGYIRRGRKTFLVEFLRLQLLLIAWASVKIFDSVASVSHGYF